MSLNICPSTVMLHLDGFIGLSSFFVNKKDYSESVTFQLFKILWDGSVI